MDLELLTHSHQFRVSIPIVNSAILYQKKDIDATLLSILNHDKEKCNHGMFIIKYTKIIERSKAIYSKNGSSQSNVSAQVEADVIVLDGGTLIIGKITNILSDNEVIVKNKHIIANVKLVNYKPKLDKVIPFYVIGAYYHTASSHISVNGAQFLPLTKGITYKFTSAPTMKSLPNQEYGNSMRVEIAKAEKAFGTAGLATFKKKIQPAAPAKQTRKFADLLACKKDEYAYYGPQHWLADAVTISQNNNQSGAIVEVEGDDAIEFIIDQYNTQLYNWYILITHFVDWKPSADIWDAYGAYVADT